MPKPASSDSHPLSSLRREPILGVKVTTDVKKVFNNKFATIVLENGALKLVKVERPASDTEEHRDMLFSTVHDLKDFLKGAQAVVDAYKREIA